jgi:uncharacterized hydrophobic protein (TIGR00271 family)
VGNAVQRSRGPWPQAWWRALTEIGSVRPERRTVVLQDITEGSNPTAIYYALLGISELIAGFALIIDSDATLIGANVVAPLMTPIFGVSLGLMRGDLRLLSRALLAEFGGAAFGVALCFVLGTMPFMAEPSAALLAQTRPTLIDLFVASLAGFAGVLAMIDERVSPALPGVAIATALNPPIAAIGLCLACGAYQGAWGAFVLFFANVLAILVVGAFLFLASGFVTRAEIGSLRGLARRFSPALIGLLLVSGLLSTYLYGLVRSLRTESAIKAVLDEALAQEPNTALVKVEFSRGEGGVDVISTVNTPRVLDPELVRHMEEDLRGRLREPVRLFMRCSVTKDVTATGSTNIRPYLNLDGKVTEAPLTPSMRLLQQAEQVAREVASTRPNLSVVDLRIVELPSRPVAVISIESSRDPRTEDVARFEKMLQERLGEPNLRVVVRRNTTTDLTSKGPILLGDAHFGAATPEEESRRDEAERAVRKSLEAIPNMFAEAVDAVLRDGTWTVRAEVVGPRVLAPAEVRSAETRSAAALGAPVALTVWSRAELQVTGQRYEILGQRAVSSPEPRPGGG